jgi:nitroreductase
MVESAIKATLIAEIIDRRSVVAFDGRPIEDSKLQAMVEAARWAPSASNRQPWRITLVRDGESRDPLNEALAPGNQAWAPSAPLLVVFATDVPDPERPGSGAKMMLDTGFAGQNLMLEAVHQGLRVHAMAGWDEGKVKDALSIPEGNVVAFVLAVGYGGDVSELSEELLAKENRDRVRNNVEEHFFDGKFGTPWKA